MSTPQAPSNPSSTPAPRVSAKKIIIGIVLIVVLAGVSYLVNSAPTSVPKTPQVYFVSLGSGKLIEMPEETLSPVTEGNGLAFRAYVFACGDCAGKKFVGYVSGYNKEDLATLKAAAPKSAGGVAVSGDPVSVGGGAPQMFIAPYAEGVKETELTFRPMGQGEDASSLSSLKSRCADGNIQRCTPP